MTARWDLAAPWADARIVSFDTETTGTDTSNDRIVELGIAVLERGVVVERFSQLVNPGIALPAITTEITGIKPEDVADKPGLGAVIDEALALLSSGVMLVYNAEFDTRILTSELRRIGRTFDFPPVLDPFPFCWEFLREAGKTRNAQLGTCAAFLGVPLEDAHRAVADAEAAAHVMFALRGHGDLPESLAELLAVQQVVMQRVNERFARFRRNRPPAAGDARSVFAAPENGPIELGTGWLYGDEPDPVRAMYARLPDVRDATPQS